MLAFCGFTLILNWHILVFFSVFSVRLTVAFAAQVLPYSWINIPFAADQLEYVAEGFSRYVPGSTEFVAHASGYWDRQTIVANYPFNYTKFTFATNELSFSDIEALGFTPVFKLFAPAADSSVAFDYSNVQFYFHEYSNLSIPATELYVPYYHVFGVRNLKYSGVANSPVLNFTVVIANSNVDVHISSFDPMNYLFENSVTVDGVTVTAPRFPVAVTNFAFRFESTVGGYNTVSTMQSSAYSPIALSQITRVLVNATSANEDTDDKVIGVDMPFVNPMFGQNAFSIGADSNGYVYFTKQPVQLFIYERYLPTTLFAGAFLGLGLDYYLKPQYNGQWYIASGGSAPNQFVVVRWERFSQYAIRDDPNGVFFTFEVVLYQSGDIRVNFIDIPTFNVTESDPEAVGGPSIGYAGGVRGVGYKFTEATVYPAVTAFGGLGSYYTPATWVVSSWSSTTCEPGQAQGSFISVSRTVTCTTSAGTASEQPCLSIGPKPATTTQFPCTSAEINSANALTSVTALGAVLVASLCALF